LPSHTTRDGTGGHGSAGLNAGPAPGAPAGGAYGRSGRRPGADANAGASLAGAGPILHSKHRGGVGAQGRRKRGGVKAEQPAAPVPVAAIVSGARPVEEHLNRVVEDLYEVNRAAAALGEGREGGGGGAARGEVEMGRGEGEGAGGGVRWLTRWRQQLWRVRLPRRPLPHSRLPWGARGGTPGAAGADHSCKRRCRRSSRGIPFRGTPRESPSGVHPGAHAGAGRVPYHHHSPPAVSPATATATPTPTATATGTATGAGAGGTLTGTPGVAVASGA